jgi:histidyl-tRNA synthetase
MHLLPSLVQRRGASTVSVLRGMHDVLPAESRARRGVESSFWSVVSRAGFSEIATPLLESTPLFARTLGDETDIVTKEMYTFASPRAAPDASVAAPTLTLRPEGTAGAVRAILAAGLARGALPARVAYAGPMFRHERPQRGRFRQFTQLGVEAVGGRGGGPADDVEAIDVAATFLRAVLPPQRLLRLDINSLGGDTSAYADALMTFFSKHSDSLSEESRARLARRAPLRILDSKASVDAPIIALAPKICDFWSARDARRFESVQAGLAALGIPFTVAPRLVRGLDYYSHTIFEFSVVAGAAASGGASDGLGTVLAGGRYDKLTALLGSRETLPAIGWAAGLERLLLLVKGADGEPAAPRPFTVAVLPLRASRGAAIPPPEDGAAAGEIVPDGDGPVDDDVMDRHAAILVGVIRAHLPAGAVAVRLPSAGNIRRLLADAAALGASAAVIVGGDELARGVVRVKDMRTGAQSDVELNVCALLGGAHAAAKKITDALRALC